MGKQSLIKLFIGIIFTIVSTYAQSQNIFVDHFLTDAEAYSACSAASASCIKVSIGSDSCISGVASSWTYTGADNYHYTYCEVTCPEGEEKQLDGSCIFPETIASPTSFLIIEKCRTFLSWHAAQ